MKKLYSLLLVLCAVALTAAAEGADTTVVVNLDFTTIAEGTLDEPVAYPTYGTGNISEAYPDLNRTYAKEVYKAGGQLLIKDGGSIRTQGKKLSGHNGIVRIVVRARSLASYGGMVKIQMGYANPQYLALKHSKYTDVQIVLTGGGSSTPVTIEPFLSTEGIVLENVRIEQSDAFMPCPVVYQPEDADGETFTARWKAVKGATAYLLNVYTKDARGNRADYLLQDADCGTATSKKVEGLDASKHYFFTLRASNGIGASEESEETEVVKVIESLATPVVVSTTIDGDRFTAKWEAVPDAEKYLVTVRQHTVLAEPATVDVLREGFDKAEKGTVSEVEYINDPNPYTEDGGWLYAENTLALSEGNMVLAPFLDAASLATPAMNLADNNGTFTATFRMMAAAYGNPCATEAVHVALLGADGEAIEEADIPLDKKEYADYTFNSDKGTAACRLQISYEGLYKVYIDEIAVQQLKPAGSVMVKPYAKASTTKTETSVPMSYLEEGATLHYTVQAVGRTVVDGEIVEIYSLPSAEQAVGGTTAIANAKADTTAPAAYYTLSGVRVSRPAKGEIYIERRGTVSRKVLFRN